MASGSSSSWSSKICIACNRVIGNRQSSLAASNSCSSTKPANARNRPITTLSAGTRLPPGVGLDAMSSEHRHCTRSISMSTKASKSKTNRKILRSSPPTSRPSLRLQDSSSTSVLPSGSIKALSQTRRVTGSCGKEPQTHGEVIRTAETEEDGSTTLAPTRKKQSEVHFKNRIKVRFVSERRRKRSKRIQCWLPQPLSNLSLFYFLSSGHYLPCLLCGLCRIQSGWTFMGSRFFPSLTRFTALPINMQILVGKGS